MQNNKQNNIYVVNLNDFKIHKLKDQWGGGGLQILLSPTTSIYLPAHPNLPHPIPRSTNPHPSPPISLLSIPSVPFHPLPSKPPSQPLPSLAPVCNFVLGFPDSKQSFTLNFWSNNLSLISGLLIQFWSFKLYSIHNSSYLYMNLKGIVRS